MLKNSMQSHLIFDLWLETTELGIYRVPMFLESCYSNKQNRRNLSLLEVHSSNMNKLVSGRTDRIMPCDGKDATAESGTYADLRNNLERVEEKVVKYSPAIQKQSIFIFYSISTLFQEYI